MGWALLCCRLRAPACMGDAEGCQARVKDLVTCVVVTKRRRGPEHSAPFCDVPEIPRENFLFP